jgi:hypothetical protein
MDLPVFTTSPKEVPEEGAPRKGLRPQSCKAKGRRLQQWCATEFKKVFPHLQGNDVRSLSMGAAGDDLILSPLALQVLPYNFEMKNVEAFQVWATIEQSMRRTLLQDQGVPTVPCIVVKRNHVQPVVIVTLGHVLDRLAGPSSASPANPWLTLEQTGVTTLNSVHVPWPFGPVTTMDKSRFNFWTVWDAQPAHALLLFNRNLPTHIIYAAMPFVDFCKLLTYHNNN